MRTLTSCILHIEGKGLESHAQHGTVDFPLGCYRDDLHVEPVSPHWHDELEVFLVMEGHAVFSAGTQKYELEPGDGLFVNAGVIHGAQPAGEGPSVLHTIVFHPRLVAGSTESVFWQDYVGKIVQGTPVQAIPLHRDVDWERHCLDAACEAVDSFLGEAYGYEFAVRAALSSVACELARHLPETERTPSSRTLRSAQRIKTMLQLIHDRYGEELTIEAIAHSASISVSECLRCFHETIGTTPIQYLKHYRVRQAARMLETTELRISDIAVTCGFKEMSYFAKAFRTQQGCTPSDYRRRVRETRETTTSDKMR